MFNTQILDVGIGLSLMYLFQCILVSGLNELTVALLALRGKGLKYFLISALKTKEGGDSIFESFANSPVLKSISYSKRFPSSMTAVNFSEALVEMLSRSDLNRITDLSFLKTRIEELPDSDFKELLKLKVSTCQDDILEFRFSMEAWYDDYMTRATKWYKRKIQYFIFTFSAIITLALNVDSFQVMNELWKNEKLRESSVQIGRDVIKDGPKTSADSNVVKNSEEKADSIKTAVNTITTSYKDLRALDFPITWAYEYQLDKPGQDLDNETFSGKLTWTWGRLRHLEKILGLLVTCIAVFFGAPLWFDIIRNLLAAKDLIKK